MEQKLLDLIIHIGQVRGWAVDATDNGNDLAYIFFQRYSPAGQDFNMSIEMPNNDTNEFLKNLDDYYENFDPDSEALNWCDKEGHGINGAPKRLKDIIIDFEEIEKEIKELLEVFNLQIEELEKAAIHKVKVQVTEYLQKVVEVDAINGSDACDKVEEMVNGPHQMFTNRLNLTQTMKMKWTYWKICEILSRTFFLIVNTK